MPYMYEVIFIYMVAVCSCIHVWLPSKFTYTCIAQLPLALVVFQQSRIALQPG
jgi:hypothetical protein